MVAGSPLSTPIDRAAVALIDVGIGNIDSVAAVLQFLGADFRRVSSRDDLAGATHVILPGVGAFGAGMEALHAHGLVPALREVAHIGSSRLLGICLGMQLLGEHSEEGDCPGLGIMPFRVRRIEPPEQSHLKVPHVGFTTLQNYAPHGLFDDLGGSADFYFTHSFAVRRLHAPANIGWAHYGDEFVAAFDAGRICGAQFHPEKSQSNGLQLMKNFLVG